MNSSNLNTAAVLTDTSLVFSDLFPGFLFAQMVPAFNVTTTELVSIPTGTSSLWDSQDRQWPATSVRDRPPDMTKPSATFSGGTRADWKAFGAETPVSSALFGDYNEVYDVCYCHSDCTTTAANYFKVQDISCSFLSLFSGGSLTLF